MHPEKKRLKKMLAKGVDWFKLPPKLKNTVITQQMKDTRVKIESRISKK